MDRRQQIQRWLALRDREHLTYRELSARSGIPANTLAHWAWRLRREDAEPGTGSPTFVELTRSPTASSGSRIEIVTRTDRRLIVDADIATELLERLVGALERC